jgi:hypothetical protein
MPVLATWVSPCPAPRTPPAAACAIRGSRRGQARWPRKGHHLRCEASLAMGWSWPRGIARPHGTACLSHGLGQCSLPAVATSAPLPRLRVWRCGVWGRRPVLGGLEEPWPHQVRAACATRPTTARGHFGCAFLGVPAVCPLPLPPPTAHWFISCTVLGAVGGGRERCVAWSGDTVPHFHISICFVLCSSRSTLNALTLPGTCPLFLLRLSQVDLHPCAPRMCKPPA